MQFKQQPNLWPGGNTGGTNDHMIWACSEPGTVLAPWVPDNLKPQLILAETYLLNGHTELPQSHLGFNVFSLLAKAKADSVKENSLFKLHHSVSCSHSQIKQHNLSSWSTRPIPLRYPPYSILMNSYTNNAQGKNRPEQVFIHSRHFQHTSHLLHERLWARIPFSEVRYTERKKTNSYLRYLLACSFLWPTMR